MITAVSVLLGLLAALYGVTGVKAREANNETLVRCNPATVAGIMGQPLAVELYVDNVVDLWAADVSLSFDTTMVRVIDADQNPNNGVQIEILDDFLSPDFLLRQNADNETGTIRYAATQVASPNPGEGSRPVSGSGALARVTFQPLQAGTSTMPFTDIEIVRRTGAEIEATAVDCQITFIAVDDPDLSIYLPVAFAQD